MSTPALILMLCVIITVTCLTVYFVYKIMKGK